MQTLLLLMLCGAPDYDADAAAALALARAARERPAIKAEPSAYDAIFARVMAGEVVVTDTLPGFPRGQYRCYLENGKPVFKPVVESGDAAPTPHAEIDRVLALLPKPAVGFVDFGCGADARWCIAAAEKWGCRVTGVEIDPVSAKAAKERVKASGLANLVTIIEGDALVTDVQADVGVAYLWPDVLEKLRPRIEKLKAFASYMHAPPVASTRNGDSWIYVRPPPGIDPDALPRKSQLRPGAAPVAIWGGQQYTGPLCSSPRCEMCAAIRQSLASQQASSGYYVKHCSNGTCWYEWVPSR